MITHEETITAGGFQFLQGTIKTLQDQDLTNPSERYFNSFKVRLKQISIRRHIKTEPNFNSFKVRLKL